MAETMSLAVQIMVMALFQIGVPGFHIWLQLPANVIPGTQQVLMAQVSGFLAPVWEA